MAMETSPSDSLYGLSVAEVAIEDQGVDWGQIALYTFGSVGVWFLDGALSWAVHKIGQWLIRRELQGQAGPKSRLALKVLKTCPRWAFTAPMVRRSEVTVHQAKTFCDTMEEADRVFQESRRVRAAGARTVAEDRTEQDQEESFRPPVTSTEKKKVMICLQITGFQREESLLYLIT